MQPWRKFGEPTPFRLGASMLKCWPSQIFTYHTSTGQKTYVCRMPACLHRHWPYGFGSFWSMMFKKKHCFVLAMCLFGGKHLFVYSFFVAFTAWTIRFRGTCSVVQVCLLLNLCAMRSFQNSLCSLSCLLLLALQRLYSTLHNIYIYRLYFLEGLASTMDD